MFRAVHPATIARLNQEGLDLLWNPEVERHIIVQKLKAPVPVNVYIRPCLTETKNGAPTCYYEYLGKCEIAYPDENGELKDTVPFQPDDMGAENIIDAVKRFRPRSGDKDRWREIDEHNAQVERQTWKEVLQYDLDSYNEVMKKVVRGHRVSTSASTMTRKIRS